MNLIHANSCCCNHCMCCMACSRSCGLAMDSSRHSSSAPPKDGPRSSDRGPFAFAVGKQLLATHILRSCRTDRGGCIAANYVTMVGKAGDQTRFRGIVVGAGYVASNIDEGSCRHIAVGVWNTVRVFSPPHAARRYDRRLPRPSANADLES